MDVRVQSVGDEVSSRLRARVVVNGTVEGRSPPPDQLLVDSIVGGPFRHSHLDHMQFFLR